LGENSKEKYRVFCDEHKDIPLFFTPKWLDVVCDNKAWDVALVEQNNEIKAVFPYQLQVKYGFKIINQPVFTPHLGIWYNLPSDELKTFKKYSLIKELTREIMDSIPPFLYFQMGFHLGFTDWQILLWKGYYQRIRYTYRLDTKAGRTELWENLNPKIRNHIRKAEEQLILSENTDTSDFFSMNMETFRRQNMDVPYQKKVLDNIFVQFYNLKQCEIYTAYNQAGKAQASMLVVWDKNTSYCIGTGKAIEADRGAVAMLTWHAIMRAKSRNQVFDFEGSDIPAIEKFYRGFGGVLTPYHQIYKSCGRLMDAFFFLTGRFR
jgi:hypothetical protein